MIRQSASTSIRHEWVKETNGQQANTSFGAFMRVSKESLRFSNSKRVNMGIYPWVKDDAHLPQGSGQIFHNSLALFPQVQLLRAFTTTFFIQYVATAI